MRITTLALFLFACEGGLGNTVVPDAMSDCSSSDGDDFDYQGGATIDGDTLSVPVGYAAGCATHELVMCWPSQAFDDSIPPGVLLEVWHDNGGETCEAYVTHSVTADLAVLQDGEPTGTVEITVGGETLDYTW